MKDASAGGRIIDPVPCSYRDPAGFVFHEGAAYKRVVTRLGEPDYSYFISCGLYEALARARLIVRHDEEPVAGGGWSRVLVPEQIPYVSYPYEWSFEQLRDAALVTLEIQALALARGMTLKDASAYNVQFFGSKPVFIDTLSFERYHGGAWVAYEQFCRHFLGPLLLMSCRWPDAARYLRVDADGFPLESVSRLLPRTSYCRPGALLHIHLHARAIGRRPPAARGAAAHPVDVTRLVESLRRTVERLRPPAGRGRWTDYYAGPRFYPPGSQECKCDAVAAALRRVRPALVYDLGANTGAYSREAARMGALCVALDSDPACVARLYLDERARGGTRILPLVVDLANPSPALGFGLEGTMSLLERPRADLALSLALLHHLRVTCNLPFAKIASFLARMARWVLAEWVPFDDPAVGALTRGTAGFDDYTLSGFLDAFTRRFRLHASWPVVGTGRVLHLFEAAP